MQALGGRGNIQLVLILDLGGWSVSRPGRYLAPVKEPSVPIVQEAGWAPEPVWTQRLEEKSFRLCRESNLARFSPGERTLCTHCTGGWVGPRAGLDTEARGKILSPLPGIEPRSIWPYAQLRNYRKWMNESRLWEYAYFMYNEEPIKTNFFH
jgi:hypothetical protein